MTSPEILDKSENIYFSLLSNFYSDQNTYLKFYSGKRNTNNYSYHDFYNISLKFASYLECHYSIKKGDKVIIKLGNSDIALISYSALMLLGAVIVPIDPSDNNENIEYIISNANAKLVISTEEYNYSCEVVVFDKKVLEEIQKKDLKINELNVVVEDDCAVIVYTSGTTSRPKGVVLTYKNLVSNAISVTIHHDMNNNHIHMCILPLFHVNAFNFSFFATLFAKSKLVLNRNFYLPNFWDIVENEKVNVVSAVPKIINLLVKDNREIKKDLSNLKYFTSAAAPLSIELAKNFVNRFGIKILQGYGMSEAVNFSLTMPINITNKLYNKLLNNTILSVGIAVPNNRVVILDPDDNELEESQIGEVAIQGDNVMQSYYNNKEESEKALKNAYLHTGDRGFFLKKEGLNFFYLVGRLKELIIKNGENIAPIELDNVIQKIKGLETSVIVGFENEYVGEEIGLFVVKNNLTPNEEEILARCKELLGEKKSPKVVLFGEKLPTTSTGKIQRLKLTQKFGKFKNILY